MKKMVANKRRGGLLWGKIGKREERTRERGDTWETLLEFRYLGGECVCCVNMNHPLSGGGYGRER